MTEPCARCRLPSKALNLNRCMSFQPTVVTFLGTTRRLAVREITLNKDLNAPHVRSTLWTRLTNDDSASRYWTWHSWRDVRDNALFVRLFNVIEWYYMFSVIWRSFVRFDVDLTARWIKMCAILCFWRVLEFRVQESLGPFGLWTVRCQGVRRHIAVPRMEGMSLDKARAFVGGSELYYRLQPGDQQRLLFTPVPTWSSPFSPCSGSCLKIHLEEDKLCDWKKKDAHFESWPHSRRHCSRSITPDSSIAVVSSIFSIMFLTLWIWARPVSSMRTFPLRAKYLQ